MALIDELYTNIQEVLPKDTNFFIGGFFPDDPNYTDCVSIVSAGGSNVINSFFDGGKDVLHPFEILIKNKNQETARNLISLIANKLNALDGEKVIDLVDISVNDEENFRGIAQDNSFIYSLLVNATVYTEE